MRINRLTEMKNYIATRDAVSVEDICEAFGISKSTLRRDLNILEEEGCITKVYGGVKFRETKTLIPFETRGVTNIEAKIAIAKKAASLVEENDIIFIDSGTTTPYIVDFLGDMRIAVVTHSLPVLAKASQKTSIELYSLPGLYSYGTYSFCSGDTSRMLERFHFTKAFMAASGLSLESGVTHASSSENQIKCTALRQSQQKYLLVDSSKMGTAALMSYAGADEFDSIITENMESNILREYVAKFETPVIIA